MSEIAILAATIEAGSAPHPPSIARLIHNAPESFDDQRAGLIAATARAMRAKGEPLNFATISERHIEFLDFITAELAPNALPLEAAEFYAEKCWQQFQVRRAKSVFGEALDGLDQAPHHAGNIIKTACAALESVTHDQSEPKLIERLEARIYSPQVKPIEPMPRFFLAGVQVSTAGNLTTLSAHAKAGKSAAIGAMIGSTYAEAGADCLGFTSENPKGLAVVRLDTEQTPFDHWDANQRDNRRAKVEAAPAWLRSYCLTGFSAADVRLAIRILTVQAAKQFGGVHSVFVDGVADAVNDVNDPAETSTLITELHNLAIEFDCPVLNIVHLNPGSDFKTRGHLGSQLERKSETNLRLEKDDAGATVIWADKNRRAPIPKSTAPRFAWSDEAGMHVTVASQRNSKDEAEKQAMQIEAEAVFSAAKNEVISYGQFVTFLEREVHASKSTAKRRFAQMLRTAIIRKELTGFYTLNT